MTKTKRDVKRVYAFDTGQNSETTVKLEEPRPLTLHSRAPNFVPSEGTKSQKPQISQNRAFFCPLKGDEIMTAA